jgi:hypothetical protein
MRYLRKTENSIDLELNFLVTPHWQLSREKQPRGGKQNRPVIDNAGFI